MPAAISIIDDAIDAIKALLVALTEPDPMGGSTPTAVYQNVYEKGDVIDREKLPYAVVHADEEVQTRISTCRYYLEVPVFIEVEYGRPQALVEGGPVQSPAKRHRTLLAQLQVAMATNGVGPSADPTLGVDGVTSILYRGRGSTLEPTDAQGGDPTLEAHAFAFATEWALRYRQQITDPTTV